MEPALVKVIKKNGVLEDYNTDKIYYAALAALKESKDESPEEAALWCTAEVNKEIKLLGTPEVHFDKIHDLVEITLMDINSDAAKAYILYRFQHKLRRAGMDSLMVSIRDTTAEVSKDNANIRNSPSSKMYEIGSAANKYYTLNYVLPKSIKLSREMCDTWIHDLDYFSLTYNCLSYGLNKLLKNGFNMPHGFIRPPKSIMSAAALTAVSLQSVQNRMGSF